MRKIIKLLTPPILLLGYQALFQEKNNDSVLDLAGDYPSWQQAMADSTGYDADLILEKTKNALLKVKNGEAAYERDSVLFDKVEYPWPLLSGLMWVAARSKGRLNVLDFGGSLGSTYFQNRAFLAGLNEVRWNIVEQALHVETGKKWFEDESLRFYGSIEDCLADTSPNVALLSSVLQYLEYPYSIFDQVLNLPLNYVILDRTAFSDGEQDRLCVQTVPPKIYPAKYPSWIFSKQRFLTFLGKEWHIVALFNNPDQMKGPVDFSYQGAVIVRKSHIS